MTAFLEVESLGLRVGSISLLENVTFAVQAGGCTALVGETGAGKSLTCRAVAGLLDHLDVTALDGRVKLGGRNLIGSTRSEWRAVRGREIGFVPQASLSALDPLMRIGAQLFETCRHLGMDKRTARDRSREMLEMVELRDVDRVLRAYPHELSGGMRQRVMIALALVGSPKLLIADEATTALDVTVQRSILRLLKELQASEGLTLLFVSHDLAAVEQVADTVVVMYAGNVVELGPTDEVLTSPAHPYTRALRDARVDRAPRGARLRTIPGTTPDLGMDRVGCSFVDRCDMKVDRCSVVTPPLLPVAPRRDSACWVEGKAADV